jgi:hypothetical protein
MVDRAARALEDAGYPNAGAMDRDAVRAALLAAFDGVPIVNYGIGLTLQFFDLVICVKDDALDTRACVYRRGSDPSTFDGVGHHLNVTWSGKGRRYMRRVDVTGIEAP